MSAAWPPAVAGSGGRPAPDREPSPRRPIDACTIVANNYLAQATLLAESYREHHPGARVFVCVVDPPAAGVRYGDLPFEVVFAEQLPIPAFRNMAFRYGVLELSTAVKPALLEHLRDVVGLDAVLYLDPDVWVLGRLAGVEAALVRSDLVLTPHLTEPLDNEFHPAERAIRLSGIYNLGFLGVRLGEETRAFLAWWKQRLARFCVSRPADGLFVDQSWMDFAPAFVDCVAIDRDPALNVAYWNLAHRRLARDEEGRWRVDGRPVGFVHFSGFDPDDTATLSRYQDRLSLRDQPALRSLLESYRAELLRREHGRGRRVPYGYGRFAGTGLPVPPLARRLLQQVDPGGRRWPDPFSAVATDAFPAWLLEPVAGEGGSLNRLVLALWEERPDLARAFRQVLGRDLAAYASWLRSGGAAGAEIPVELLAGVEAREPPRRRRADRPLPLALHTLLERADPLAHFDLAHPGTNALWLNQPLPGTARRHPVLTRLALFLYTARTDVQRAYPDPFDTDQVGFAAWFVRHGAVEYRLHRSLVTPIERSLGALPGLRAACHRGLRAARAAFGTPRPRLVDDAVDETVDGAAAAAPAASRSAAERPIEAVSRSPVTRGVNVLGYFRASSGVGEIGRGSLAALVAAGLPHVRFGVDRRLETLATGGGLAAPEGLPYAVSLLHCNADETPRVLSLMPSVALAGGARIGCWFWELAHFPLAFAASFHHLDEIWAPTRFCQAAFAPLSPIPVHLVPPCVATAPRALGDRARFGIDEKRFTFLFAFDVTSVPERKNPLGLITAFRELRAAGRRDVELVLKVSNAAQAPELMATLRHEAEGLPVRWLLRDLERGEMSQLVASCDAVVSLHRSEGLGLLLVEALAQGRPVVATAYGGVTDFLDAATGFPVEYDLVALGEDLPPYPRGAVWAEPRLESAVAAMERVVDDRSEARRRTEAGTVRVRELYGTAAAAARLGRELERVFAGLEAARERRAPATDVELGVRRDLRGPAAAG